MQETRFAHLALRCVAIKHMYSAKELISDVISWKNERRILEAQNRKDIASGQAFQEGGLFLGEVEEFREALTDVKQGKGEDVDVASELSDIIFLCISALEHFGDNAIHRLENALKISKALERKSNNDLTRVWGVATLHLLRRAQELPYKSEDEVWTTLMKIAQLSAVGLFAYGFEPIQAVKGKLKRNEEKYPVELFQSGVYSEQTRLAKKRWESQKATENQKYVGHAKLPSRVSYR